MPDGAVRHRAPATVILLTKGRGPIAEVEFTA
jgi:hypothetical protein